MFNLYIYQGDVNSIPGGGESIASNCIADWTNENQSYIAPNQIKMYKNDKGKPFVEKLCNIPVQISISHTRNIWAIMVGETLCGLDIQYQADVSEKKIANKYFSDFEKLYIKAGKHFNGRNVTNEFFDIWTVREAFGKITGEGFWGDFPSFVTVDETVVDEVQKEDFCVNKYKLKDILDYQGQNIRITKLELKDLVDNNKNSKSKGDKIYGAAAILQEKPNQADIKVIKVEYQEEKGFIFL